LEEAFEQPEVNIGLVGHVDHGKTTLVKALSGKWTDTHSEEIKRGITIRLGYADLTIYKRKGAEEPYNFTTVKEDGAEPVRVISLVDAPGHESLMATMLAGTTIMDGALLLISAAEDCPQPQTKEHLMALQIIGIDKVIVVQNKIDLVDEEQTKKNYGQIKAFLKGTRYENSSIIPISAQHNLNVDLLTWAIQTQMPTPKRDATKEPVMLVARSFDVNKPGTEIEKLQGGVLGGSLKQGIFKVGDEVEIRPGHEVEEKNQKIWKPIKTKVTGLVTGNKHVDEVHPGGSIGLMTNLDPSIVKSDTLTGALVGHPDKLPPVLYELKLEINLLERVLGTKEELKVEPIKMLEPLMLNVNSAATVGVVTKLEKGFVFCKLKIPVCADKGARITVSRRLGNRFRLIGYAIVK
jgi:translation initiation factor 2 subunit 3